MICALFSIWVQTLEKNVSLNYNDIEQRNLFLRLNDDE